MSVDSPAPADLLAALRDPATLRLRCAAVTRAVESGDSGWFTLDRARLPEAAARVAERLQRRAPGPDLPPPGEGIPRATGTSVRRADLVARLESLAGEEQVRARIDLAVLCALMDTDAGAAWRYVEALGPGRLALPVQQASRDELLALLDQAASGRARPAETAAAPPGDPQAPACAQAEGLAVACERAFVAGAFSAEPAQPCRVDASVLRTLDAAAVRAMFQAGPSNPLLGPEGRAGVLARLGQTLQALHDSEGLAPRPSAVLELLTDGFSRAEVDAHVLLQALLRRFAPVWHTGPTVCGQPAGDVWPHRWAGAACGKGSDPLTARWVPFHRPGHRLCLALVEPLQQAGVRVTNLEALAGLPELHHGALLLDSGVVVPRAPADLQRVWTLGDEFVVEWRALTVSLLEALAGQVREALGLDATRLPMTALLAALTETDPAQDGGQKAGESPVRVRGDGVLI